MIRILCYLLVCFPLVSHPQRIDIDLFGGISNYQGDLQPEFFTIRGYHPGFAVIFKYGFTENIYLRTGISFGAVSGNDSYSTVSRRSRNLNFKSKLQEFDIGLEYRVFKPSTFPVTPYGFIGAGVFHFNPYTFYGPDNKKVFLQPLSTEGQGLAEYPEKKVYQLTQLCIPYGMGIKWQVNCNLNVGFEFRHTKTFTDYIDDVSTTYADHKALLSQKGQLAVDLAWRRDDYDGRPYPSQPEETVRGNPLEKDWFYFAGITVGLKLNDCESGMFTLGGIFKSANGSVPKSGRSGWGRSSKKAMRHQLSCPRF